MKNILSPISGTPNVKKLDHFEKSISSESKLINASIDNFVCLESGLIFNQSGSRNIEMDFYENEYDLHSENDFSEFKYQSNNGFIGIYDNIIQFIFSNINLKDKGDFLDIGCGKGLLIKKFSEQKTDWNLFGIEPSLNASFYHRKIVPQAEISINNFENASLSKDKFDFISANGVLEHVSQPVKFLEFIKEKLNGDGFCFIGVPNFNTNPADLFTYDHLSRFTPATIKRLFSKCGFKIIAESVTNDRVPMWYLIKKSNEISFSYVNVESEINNYKKHLNQMNKSFNSFQTCVDNSKGEKIGIYGTGSVFLLSTLFRNVKFSDVECFVDNNESIVGSSKNGVPIHSPEYLSRNKINNIIISSNPCYHDQIKRKIFELGLSNINIYT